ncbi:MAG: hypothetical protein GX800_13410, partial [Clostridiaceae bacterium]|nr:hypothetical protein [Clostridiaceae bacterium]
MLCNKCNQEIPDDSKFCRFCGARAIQPTEVKLEQNAVCPICRKELSEGVKFCKFCGAPVSLKSEDEAVHKAEMTDIDSQTSEPEESTDESGNDDSTYPNQQEYISPAVRLPSSYIQPIFVHSKQQDNTHPSDSKFKTQDDNIVDTSANHDDESSTTNSKSLIRMKLRKYVNDYKNFQQLSRKDKIVHVIVPLIILVIILGLIPTNSKSEIAKNCAVAQIQKQTYTAGDKSVYDVRIVAEDGEGRYIITGTTKGVFETWWVVLVTLLPDGESYRAVANYHGNGISSEDWIEIYKTNSDYGWS